MLKIQLGASYVDLDFFLIASFIGLQRRSKEIFFFHVAIRGNINKLTMIRLTVG